MKLHDLKPSPGSKKNKIRVGRGRRGRRGKTAGRGTKGDKARGSVPVFYEGGQMPLHRRIPKLGGFRSPNRVAYTSVNISKLDQFDAGSTVDPDVLRSKGLVRKKGLVKVLGDGELTKSLTVKAHAFSKTAEAAITGAGGTAEKIETPELAGD
jgi:large subunit ribosomal protein L15